MSCGDLDCMECHECVEAREMSKPEQTSGSTHFPYSAAQFVHWYETEVEPARLAKGFKPLDPNEMGECYRVLVAFFAKINK